jgi:hypothetical protein
VFAYSVYYDDEWIRDENLYSSYEGVLRAANDDNDLSPKLSSIRKRFLDCPNNTWYAYLSPKLEIMRIENSNSPMSDEDFEILYEVFEEIKNKYQVVGVEMESFALYNTARILNKKASHKDLLFWSRRLGSINPKPWRFCLFFDRLTLKIFDNF